jgi:hypothetical protein
MGTKKGQRRKTARRAYEKERSFSRVKDIRRKKRRRGPTNWLDAMLKELGLK